MLRYVLSAAAKDLRRLRSDPGALLTWLGIPLVVGVLITLATGGRDGPRPVARLLVVDQDESLGSQLLRSALDQAGGVIRTESVTADEGAARIENGEASALLSIPAGFGAAVLADAPTRLELRTNPAERILPGIVEQLLSVVCDGAFYAQRLFGDELATVRQLMERDRAPSEAEILAVGLAVRRVLTDRGANLWPPPVDLEVRAPVALATAEAAPTRDVGVLYLAGILLMALFFAAQGLSEDLWTERAQGTLRRAAAGPQPLVGFLAGKVLAGAAVMLMIAVFGLAIGAVYHGIPVWRLPSAALWAMSTGCGLLAFMLLLQMLCSSRRAGAMLTNALLFPLLMLGGSFFVFDMLPGWMATVGRWTPNGWALDHLQSILCGTWTPMAAVVSYLVLATALALAFVLGAGLLRRRFV